MCFQNLQSLHSFIKRFEVYIKNFFCQGKIFPSFHIFSIRTDSVYAENIAENVVFVNIFVQKKTDNAVFGDILGDISLVTVALRHQIWFEFAKFTFDGRTIRRGFFNSAQL